MSADPLAPGGGGAPPRPPGAGEDAPRSWFDKLGAALPVALTAIATAFAGMSTSEMSRAMYWRSAAAQDQAKANDQWTLAGFKRDRSLMVQTAAAQLTAAAGYRRPSPGVGGAVKPTTPPPLVARVGKWQAGKAEAPTDDPGVAGLLDAIRDKRPEDEAVQMAKKVKADAVQAAITAAERAGVEVETAWDAEVEQVAKLAKDAAAAAAGAGPAQVADANLALAAKYDTDYRRYRAESTLNYWIGYQYEVRVKKSAAESDRHRSRSENFFYAMLAGQVGATLAALGLARKRKSAIWLLAGVAGLVAVGFGGFVYLTM